ncbi:MAG: cytochrome c biogenesis protein ResB [Chlorobium sp.]|uniref:cytochrome c biogenesis protein ResB n=1 Tax=Chlorobium sp. TaxID=1095 RepID=UPI0025C3C9DA|nr:cytochrome c biogenesis protein ResB [Chlorobium sp.]MCF8382509.1 cytochrome c biogenesis protein ResB [Chlorobium sp.]
MSKVSCGWFEDFGSFRLSSIVTLLVIAAGFIIQYLAGGEGVPVLSWPLNAVFIAVFFVLLFLLGVAFRNNPFVVWLGGIPLGLSLIFGIAFLSLLGGVIPQGGVSGDMLSGRLGVNRIFSGWPFLLTVFLFLSNLGLAVVWKTIPFRLSNLQFMLFHGGFWIALASGLAGAPDLQRLIIPVYEGRQNSRAYIPQENRMVQLPFSVYLDDFSIEEYSPQLVLYDPQSDRVIPGKPASGVEVGKGYRAVWPGFEVRVLDYLQHALPDSRGNPRAADPENGIPYARVRISADGKSVDRWLNTGSPSIRPGVVQLDRYFLVMFPGTPKVFRSGVVLSGSRGNKPAVLEVNKPVEYDGWKLYQMGYDEKAGRWSQLSLIEAVRDPWLPVVYCGFFMIMAGNAMFFWKGMKRGGVV